MGEQLFSELHRRHPDVDLVVLPPEPPLAPAPEASEADLAAAAIAVGATGRHLWTTLAPDAVDDPVVRWSFAADPGRVRVTARAVERRADGPAPLTSLRRELEAHGWAVARAAAPGGAVERLVGRLDDLEVTATWAAGAGAVVLTVASRPLVVGVERAATLAGRRPRAVAGGEG
ncbi:hypothetical protein GCM10023340_37870 [Nocardioides marinquilinus]|uniref:Uncharacterized protein n=1 Tax=Nocardioides marinquilinus TaxID=1210400 RepID=A0ABP9PZT2_9ACTN